MAPGQPARDVQEVGATVRGQREGDAVVLAGSAWTPDHAPAAELDLLATDAEKRCHVAGRRRTGA